MSALVDRVLFLITRHAEWVDTDTGEVAERTHESWRTAWAIAGIHSYNWRWVRKYGRRECGCVYNPVTRRQLIYCSHHAGIDLFEEEP